MKRQTDETKALQFDGDPKTLAKIARKRAARSALRSVRTPFIAVAAAVLFALIGVPLILNGTVLESGLPARAALKEPEVPAVTPAPLPSVASVPTPSPVATESSAAQQDEPTAARFDTASYTDIEPGVDSAAMIDIQSRLMQLGYMESAEPTEHFGSATEEAVKRFQNSHYITVTGALDALTQAVLFSGSAKLYVLDEGDKGGEVSQLQARLTDLLYYNDKENGYFGTATARALSAFQVKNGLVATGSADEETRALVYSPRAVPAVDPTPTPTPKPTKTPSPTKTPKPAATAKLTPTPSSGIIWPGTTSAGGWNVPDPNPETPAPAATDSAWNPQPIQTVAPTQNPFDGETLASADVSGFLAVARMQEGKPYVYSTEGPNSFDCSGFVYFSLRSVGVKVKRYSAAGFSELSAWQTIQGKGNLIPGDLIFFRNDSSAAISHTGIWLGGNSYIHASSSAGKVVVSTWSDWSARNFVMGKRVF